MSTETIPNDDPAPMSDAGLPRTDTRSSSTTVSAMVDTSGQLSKEQPTNSMKGKPAAPPGVLTAPVEVSKWRFWAIFLALSHVDHFPIRSRSTRPCHRHSKHYRRIQQFDAGPKAHQWFLVSTLGVLKRRADVASLTLLGFILIYSQFMQILPSKDVLCFAIFIFEVESLVCGVAPSIDVSFWEEQLLELDLQVSSLAPWSSLQKSPPWPIDPSTLGSLEPLSPLLRSSDLSSAELSVNTCNPVVWWRCVITYFQHLSDRDRSRASQKISRHPLQICVWLLVA